MKKECHQNPCFFFSEKEDVTVDDVRDIGYVGRSNNIIAVDCIFRPCSFHPRCCKNN